MLKAKINLRNSKRKSDALKEVLKDDNLKAVNALISKQIHKKLRSELLEREITFAQWITEKII